MKILQQLTLVVAVMFALTSLELNAQTSTGSITGKVEYLLESYSPPSQRVLLSNASGRVIAEQFTNASGEYTFKNLATGTYSITKQSNIEFGVIEYGDYEEDGDPNDTVYFTDEVSPIEVVLTEGEVDSGNNFVGLELANGPTLPVTYSNFTAERNNNNVNLNWSTELEINNEVFEIERSVDGSNFITIGVVNGSGTTNFTHNYSFVDYNVASTTLFYRIKQVDFDGQSSLGNIITVDASLATLVEVFPTNVVTHLTVKGIKDEVKYEIYNRVGQTILEGYTSGNIDMSNVDTGLYIVRLIGTDGSVIATEKVFK